MPMVAMLMQNPKPAAVEPAPKSEEPPKPADAAPKAILPPKGPATEERSDGEIEKPSLVGPVQIEMLGDLDVLVLRGNLKDVQQVMEIIQQIERLSAVTEPIIQMVPMRYVDCQILGLMVRQLYDEVYLQRQGGVSITPLVKPNSLLVIGRKENVARVVELVRQLDKPSAPGTQSQVFHLRNATAATVQAQILEFFFDRGGLSPLVRVTVDARSNSLFVQASPRDMLEVARMIHDIDTTKSETVNHMKIIRLEHSLAQDLANILQSAVGAAVSGARATTPGVPGAPGAPGGAPGFGAGVPGAAAANQQRSAMLRFLTIDAKGRRLVESGILSDVRITADVRSNSLVVSAPAESMDLIEALIHQLDRMPVAEAQIKVFTIVNGDATNLMNMLQMLFATQQTTGGMAFGMGGAAIMLQSAAGAGETSLLQLRFAVDTRTNSIIASGSMGDLQVVEAILMRLDESDVRHRKSSVFRLKNSPATDVANAINQFLTSERQVQTLSPGLTSAAEQIEREVVVVPEPVSNSLILSATPRFYEDVRAIIEQLDARPPMVMIQVLIAQVDLGNTDEFGMEVGLQDSVLFDRSVLSNIQTLTTTVTSPTPNTPALTTQRIVAANNNPGFAFTIGGGTLGNSGSDAALGGAKSVGPQGLSDFALGRQNSTLGFGGLVLSASSENVSMLLRALSESHRTEVLQRPQVMTLDNQPAYIQVGQRVPRITGTTVNTVGQVNNITLENVGLILGVTPRISPDGLVVMEIDAEKSELGAEADGIPVSISGGQVIRSPRINTTTAQTTVSALSGQTVVLGGLISRSKTELHRKVPLLGDVPLLGRLFRYDGTTNTRTELMIIMTPHIIHTEADADAIKRTEAAKMSWCLCDVTNVYGEAGLRKRTDTWSDAEIQTIYPDAKSGQPVPGKNGVPGGPELVPAPAGVPNGAPQTAPPPLPGQLPGPLGAAPAGGVGDPSGRPAAGPQTQPQPSGTELRVRTPEQAVSPSSARFGPIQPVGYRGPAAPAAPALPAQPSPLPGPAQPAVYPPPGNPPANSGTVQAAGYQQPDPAQPPGAQYPWLR
jgi:general secretion pathway protein D